MIKIKIPPAPASGVGTTVTHNDKEVYGITSIRIGCLNA